MLNGNTSILDEICYSIVVVVEFVEIVFFFFSLTKIVIPHNKQFTRD